MSRFEGKMTMSQVTNPLSEFVSSEWNLSDHKALNETLTKAAAALDYCQLLLTPKLNPESTVRINLERLMEIVIDAQNALDRIEHTYPQYSNIVGRYIVWHSDSQPIGCE